MCTAWPSNPRGRGNARDRRGGGRKRERNEERKRNQRVTVRERERVERKQGGRSGSMEGKGWIWEGRDRWGDGGWEVRRRQGRRGSDRLAGSRSVGRKGVKRRNNSQLSCRVPGAAEPRPACEMPNISCPTFPIPGGH